MENQINFDRKIDIGETIHFLKEVLQILSTYFNKNHLLRNSKLVTEIKIKNTKTFYCD